MTSRKKIFDAQSIQRPAILALEPRLIFDGALVPTLDVIADEPVNPVDPRRDARSTDDNTLKQETRTQRLRSTGLDADSQSDATVAASKPVQQDERVLVDWVHGSTVSDWCGRDG